MSLLFAPSQVDPMLFSLVRKDLSQQGPRHMVLIGDKLVDYNEKFRLFFSTRNPHVREGPLRATVHAPTSLLRALDAKAPPAACAVRMQGPASPLAHKPNTLIRRCVLS